MLRPKLIFKSYKNSFSVYIENLTQIEVIQIKELEKFVYTRGGIFDFEKQMFVIQKRLDFFEFTHLLKECKIDAFVLQSIQSGIDKARVGFGKYKGCFYEDIPDSYLLWLKNNYYGADRKKLEDEINKRGI